MLRNLLIALITFTLTFPIAATAQVKTGTVSGVVKDENGKAVADVRVGVSGTAYGMSTDDKGQYKFQAAAGTDLILVYAALGYDQHQKRISLQPGEVKTINIRLKSTFYHLNTVVKKDDRAKMEAGGVYIDPKKAHQIAGPIGGIEGLIKTLVGSTNELTSQYSVRGGNYDENLVYVNDFEIYRPFLVRSGQQEGLSFVNADLASSVNFSIGGFQAKYGDKMSSVLDVTYKRPVKFAGSVMASLLGASIHLEGASKDTNLTYLIGVRQKSNQYLLNSQPTKGVYNPSFSDFQALVNYRIGRKWEIEAIGNYARNRFAFLPESQTSSFGVLNKAYQLSVFYQGGEIDQFDSRFGGISTTFRPNERLKLKLLASAFKTNEKETYDISGEYLLGELETDLGKANFNQIKTSLGTGIIQDYARNYLVVDVVTAAHRGSYSLDKHFIQWGADLTHLSINDKLHQWQRRDSAGFTQPYNASSLDMQQLYVASNVFDYYRASAYVQDNFRFRDSVKFTGSLGMRYTYNSLNKEALFSPRLQLGYKPAWQRDITFRFATGWYAQPPFYREMRDLNGNTNTNVLAQKSFHILAGSEYNFKVSSSPFRITTELYYKQLWDLVPYEYDGIKIRYYGRNDGRGYAYGGEVRLYADLVKDATSWISLGVMKTAEQVKTNYPNAAGGDSASVYSDYIPRPTDQRLMLAMYFQDYLRQNKNFRVHINLMYGTGLPFGPPDGSRIGDTLRMPAYKRVDIGFSALLLDGHKPHRPAHSFFRNLESIWASVEIFNLLDIQNTLSYNWIQDQTSSKVFAVPNRLTSRLFNVKFVVSF